MGPRAGGPTVVVPAVTVPIEVARTPLDILRLTEELDAAGVDSQVDSTEAQSIRLRRECCQLKSDTSRKLRQPWPGMTCA